MTETTKEIFEKYQVRKNRKQKSAFIDYVKGIAADNGFEVQIQKGSLGSRNIVVGDVDRARVVYAAHYDTCPRLPFPNFITPKNFGIYLLYQLLLTVVLCAVILGGASIVTHCLYVLGVDGSALYFVRIFLVYFSLFLILAGPANKHTANDNTSGVTTLIDIMTAVPKCHQDRVAFVFFDLEESGLIGSASFARQYKKQMKNKPLINFDCVSDGENILFALRKGSVSLRDVLAAAFEESDCVTVEIAEKGVFYPSDQMNFSCGVGVAALKCSKRFKVLYMDRIHTSKDTVYREENVEFLKNGSLKLLELL